MKTTKYLSILFLSLSMASCVNDKASSNTDTKTLPKAKIERPVTPSAAKESAKTITPPARSTENIKVNMPGSTSTPTKSNMGATAGAKQDASSGLVTKEERAEKARAVEKAKNTPAKKREVIEAPQSGLPSACDLVSPEFISKTLGKVEARDIYVKDGSGKKAVSSRSCFFKWDDAGNINAGVLIQIQKNPLPEEFPDWASYYIRAKRDQGDQMPDGSGTFRYKDFPGMGIAGAYNYDLARYTWRTNTDNVFMVAFNLRSSEAEQLIWAEKIGREIMSNFNKTKN